jgi:ubiquinone/menaquinone biosynthesis C-methylase UbiE
LYESTHKKNVKKEFSKQVKSLERAKFFTDKDILKKIKNASNLSEKMTVLDAGCGPGIVTEALAPYVREIVAYDLTPEMVEATRIRCENAGIQNVRYHTGMIESLPFDDEYFDRIISRLVLHHLLEPTEAFREIYRVLKKKGRLILADIISSEEPEKEKLHNSLEVLRDPSHSRMLPESEMIKSLNNSGFDVSVEDAWIKEREFSEWIAITNSPERVAPLKTVMTALAKCRNNAGVNLRSDDETVYFDHKWILISASK